jgi:proteasome assembly chaperone (PAC2) family protein
VFNYEVFKFVVKNYKPRLVVTIGGLISNQQQEFGLPQVQESSQEQVQVSQEEPKRYYIFTNNEIQEKIKQRIGETNLNLAPQFLQVSGAAGLFQGFAKLLGIPGFCILVEVRDAVVDIYAAKYLIIELSKALNLKMDLSEIEKKIEEQEEILKEVKEKTEEILKKIQSKQTKYRI